MGCPNVLTTRPTIPSPTLIEAISPVRFTISPSFISVDGPKRVIPTLSSSRLRTIPFSPLSNFTNSPYCAFDSPKIRAIPSPTCNTVPTSSKDALASKCANCSFKIAEISAALISAIFFSF